MGHKKWDWLENLLLVKNPQFLSNQADILPKSPIHEPVILTKWHNDWVKIVDFFKETIFWSVLFFITHTL